MEESHSQQVPPAKYVELNDALYEYVVQHRSHRDDPVLDALRAETATLGDAARMLISREQGDFLTLLSPHQIGHDGALVAIGDPIEKTRRPIGLTMRADWRPAPAQQAFIDLLRDLTGAKRLRGIE